MPRQKQYASAADRLREYRKRQRAEKAAAALPSPEQIKTRDETGEQVEQLSRASGVPRNYPRSVWKKAAEALIGGDGEPLAKVKALKSLCNVDKDWRKKVAEWVRTDQSDAVKKYIVAQGWELTDTAAKPESISYRIVLAVEEAQRDGTIPRAPRPVFIDPLQFHHAWDDPAFKALRDEWWTAHVEPFIASKFTTEELNQPDHEGERIMQLHNEPPKPVQHGCSFCGFKNGPATRQITICGRQHHYCESHDGSQGQSVSPPVSPAEDALVNAQRAEADEARSYDGTGSRPVRANYGPQPTDGTGQPVPYVWVG
jgi:hypothetical protein